eukprot:CAMPEP_0171157342 /NCGR_PEP_ID=MMETSP0790-20130122/1918_1 /TAXON_ID=2925 /ORGANISM="Alexandrium catenella, Strain OF101" /LENGTH=176 /DNA_ID=CAMNT_0011621693 /DNA_START=81 /DNA_END=611 /DNA_ORIENTATION=-
MSLILSLGGFGHSLGVLYGSCMLEAFGVVHRHYEHFVDASAVCAVIQLVPLFFVPLLIPPGVRPCDDVSASFGGGDADKQMAASDASPALGMQHKGSLGSNASTSMERRTSVESTVAPSSVPTLRCQSDTEFDLEFGRPSSQAAEGAAHGSALGGPSFGHDLEPLASTSSDSIACI